MYILNQKKNSFRAAVYCNQLNIQLRLVKAHQFTCQSTCSCPMDCMSKFRNPHTVQFYQFTNHINPLPYFWNRIEMEGGKTNSQNSCIWNELQNKRGPRPWNRANFSIWRTRCMRNVTITAHTHWYTHTYTYTTETD